MRKQQGFTLIELVVVIIILGILAVTAAPRFIDVQSDAKESVINGLAGSLKASADLIYAQAAIDNQLSVTPGAVTIADGTKITTHFGYPGADDANGIIASINASSAAVTSWTKDSTEDWMYSIDSANDTVTFVPTSILSSSTMPTKCIVTYDLTDSLSGGSATSASYKVTVTGGC